MALPLLTVAVPTVVPPVVQVVGALVRGPKTVKVMVPLAFEPEDPVKAEVMLPAVMAVPAVPVAGTFAVTVGVDWPTTVLDIVPPQVEVAALLLVSPL